MYFVLGIIFDLNDLLKNVLIDQNCKDLEQDEYKELLNEYDSKFVGKKQKL